MNHWTIEQCNKELAYIKSINPLSPPKEFNYDKAVFLRYVHMQKKEFSRFPSLVNDCDKIIKTVTEG